MIDTYKQKDTDRQMDGQTEHAHSHINSSLNILLFETTACTALMTIEFLYMCTDKAV